MINTPETDAATHKLTYDHRANSREPKKHDAQQFCPSRRPILRRIADFSQIIKFNE
jgi:hypothetical protein